MRLHEQMAAERSDKEERQREGKMLKVIIIFRLPSSIRPPRYRSAAILKRKTMAFSKLKINYYVPN